jgi:L-gulono-1,4-lactone dehydrogenase
MRDRASSRPVWSNWSGIETCTPVDVVQPSSVEALQDAASTAAARGLTIRAVGSGHSFTGAAVAPGIQIRLDGLDRLVEVEEATGQVTVEAGMPLYRLNPLLAQYGLAMPNLGDIDRQTIAGAISTGTHGTGALLTGLAAQVASVEFIAADGSLRRCSATVDPALFDAVRVSLGALGILARVTLQAVPAFRLRAYEVPASLDHVLDGIDDLVDGHDHFEFYWFPHTMRTLTKRNDRVSDGIESKPLSRWRHLIDDELLSNVVFEGTNRLSSRWPTIVPKVNAVAARALSSREYVDASYQVLVSSRRVRFNECEYAIPRAAIPHVLQELRQWIDTHDVKIPFPVEVRFAAADDLWLSTAFERPSGYVAIHQYHRMSHDAYFGAFEAIAAEVAGRPHWGKLHSLDADRLRELYPRFADFVSLRDRLDPKRLFANPYTNRVFGA